MMLFGVDAGEEKHEVESNVKPEADFPKYFLRSLECFEQDFDISSLLSTSIQAEAVVV